MGRTDDTPERMNVCGKWPLDSVQRTSDRAELSCGAEGGDLPPLALAGAATLRLCV